MPVRWVIHRDALNRLDASGVLRELADDVADDARRIAPVDEGDLRSTIRVSSVGKVRARISAGGMPGGVTGKPVDYPHYVERGTSKMSAQPYLRPALFRYRGRV